MNVKTQPWSEIRVRYEDFIQHGWRLNVLLTLLDWINKESLELELHAITSMDALMLSNKEDFMWGENTLRIQAFPNTKVVHFMYSRLYASTDMMEKTVPEEEAVETLRQFLAYKFGIHREVEADSKAISLK